MNRIEHLIAHPLDVKKSDIPLLKNEIEKHPYFYSLRALLLYGLKHENHPSFEDQLHQTSIYSNNRVDLYHYLNSNPLSEKERTHRVNVASALYINNKSTSIPEIEIPKIALQDTTLLPESNLLEVEGQTIGEEANNLPEVISIEHDLTDKKDFIEHELENNIKKDASVEKQPSVESSILEEKNYSDTFDKPEEVVDSYDKPTKSIVVTNTEKITDKESDKIQSILNEIPPIISNDLTEHIKDDPTITTESIPVATDGITFSFNDWLKHSQPSNDETVIETTEKEIKYQLIDDFLERNPKISPLKKNDPSPNTVSVNFQQNSEEYSDLMTETLAQIYIEQKKYDKAIKAYKILSLKYPEKNSLFANRIKEIEKFKNTKS